MHGGIVVGPATQRDARAIASIHVGGWRDAYRGLIADRLLEGLDEERIAIRWSQIIAIGEQLVLAARAPGGEVVAFASAGAPSAPIEGFDCELHKLYVLRDAQRCGIGEQLLRSTASRLVDSGCRALFLHMLADTPAGKFYQRHGAKLLGVSSISIDGDEYLDAVYGWERLEELAAPTRATTSR